MCNPLAILGGVFKGIGSIAAGQRSAAAAKAEARLFGINADLAATQGLVKENALRRQVDRVVAAGSAAAAARNLDPAFGTPLAAAAFSAAQGELDARLIRSETEADVASALAGKAAAERRASDARFAGWFGAATAALSTASDLWTNAPSRGGAQLTVSGIPSWGGPR